MLLDALKLDKLEWILSALIPQVNKVLLVIKAKTRRSARWN
jgi:hypothetical protein